MHRLGAAPHVAWGVFDETLKCGQCEDPLVDTNQLFIASEVKTQNGPKGLLVFGVFLQRLSISLFDNACIPTSPTYYNVWDALPSQTFGAD